MLREPMDYGKPRPGRIAFAGVVATILYLFVYEIDSGAVRLAVSLVQTFWLLGVGFRLVDMRFRLNRVNRYWFMSHRAWVIDFALRGYFNFKGDEPLLH